MVALTLAVLGVPDEAIVDDYAKSDAAYKELADRDAMVGALSQVRSCFSATFFLCIAAFVAVGVAHAKPLRQEVD